ncbi:unnamed protein product [Linum trigynum]|uniref:Uncharacterized protein n=1 Tax=Linum trigynum TaxID=586398 RepID=A0AAV2EJL2_9ROSI
MEQEQEQQQQTWKVWEDGWKANLKLLGIDRVLQQQLLFAYCCVEMDETNAELIGSGLLLDKTNAQLHVIHLSALQTLEATPSNPSLPALPVLASCL